MKKFALLLICFLTLSLSLCGCQYRLVSNNVEFYSITSEKVYGNTTLPKTYSNTEDLVNDITINKMKAVVTVFNEQYTGFFGIKSSGVSISQGSAGIFHYENGVYYALTNNHVACRDSSLKSQDLYVEDYLGNVYGARIYKNPSKDIEAISAAYDLAVICFSAPFGSLETFDFGNENPTVNQKVYLIGTPEGQRNAILCGTVKGYIVPVVESRANKIEFEVVTYSAASKHGSSGGPLLNDKLEIVGVHFGGSENRVDEYGGAIPLLKVKEFLNRFCLSA